MSYRKYRKQFIVMCVVYVALYAIGFTQLILRIYTNDWSRAIAPFLILIGMTEQLFFCHHTMENKKRNEYATQSNK